MLPEGWHLVDCEFLSPFEKLGPVLLLFVGLVVCVFMVGRPPHLPPTVLRAVYTFFNRRQFYDKLINDLVSMPLFRWGFGVTTNLIDKGIIEVLIPVGLTNRNRLGPALLWAYAPWLRTVCVVIGTGLAASGSAAVARKDTPAN